MRHIYTSFLQYFLLIFTFTIFSNFCYGQKEWSNWYSNGKNLLTFKNGYPEIVKNFITPNNTLFNFYNWGNGGISYSDPVTGTMKFIISNRVGFDRNYADFPNDNLIRSCPDKFSYHIIPFTSNSNKFYVVQFQDYSHDLTQTQSGLQVRCPNAIGLGYSIADLSLNGGLGDFSLINQIITSPLTSQITTVRHANGKDVWVIVHGYNTDKFRSYLFTDAGIQPAVQTSIGPYVSGTVENILGTLTASHDGKLLAGTAGVYSGKAKGVQLFNFNNATGILSNYRILPFDDFASRLQFSPDNSKLYCLGYQAIYQYDLNSANIGSTITKVIYQPFSNLYDMQLAPDGKIYVSKTTVYENNEYTDYTGAIQCPNLPQYACNFNPKALTEVQVSFPDLINDFINDPKAPAITKFNLGKDTAICFGNLTIKAPAGWESYKWNTGETTKDITVKKPGLYFVLSGNTGFSCPQGYGYINVFDKAIKLDLGKDTSLCPKTSFLLNINKSYTNILWQNGSTTHDSLISSNSSIIISAFDRNGCFTNDTINIYFKYDPRANFGNDTVLCNNQILLLQLEPRPNPFGTPGTFLWQNGSVKDTFRATQPGTYWGQVSYQGCTVRDTIIVNYVNAANVTLGRDTTLCSGDSFRLQTNILNGSFLWSTGEKTSSIIVKTGGAYWVSVNNGSCSVRDTINVTFLLNPGIDIGPDLSKCNNDTLSISAPSGFISYEWTPSYNINSTTSQTVKVYPSLDTIYKVKAEKSPGCFAYDSVRVKIYTSPKINLGADKSLCAGDSLILNAGNGFSNYLWSTGATSQLIMVRSSGSYSVTAITKDQCTSKDTLIILSVSPKLVLKLDQDSTLCSGSTRILNPGNFNSYLWSTGNTSQTISINNTGVYSVTVTDNNNCKGSDSVKIVTILPSPSNFLPADSVLCSYGSMQLSSKVMFSNYLWNTNAVTPFITVTQPGVYWLQVKGEKNCSGRDSIVIAQKDCLKGFFITTAFSPNNDGRNDLFRPMLFGKVKFYEFTIYNRWGQIVFKSNDLYEGWTGKYKGVSQETNIYVWTCKYQFENESGKIEKGTVMLLR